MPKRLQNRGVFVTGGAVRIGKAICELFSEAGFSVVIHYRSSGTQARALAARLRKAGNEAWTVSGRLDTEAGCRKVIAEAWRVSGGFSVLVNNASIYEVAGAAESKWMQFSRTFATNLFGPACLSSQFYKRTLRRKGMTGCIVNILDRRIAGIGHDSVAYTLSKKALAEYTRITALEFAPTLRVNAVAPGAILPAKGRGTKRSVGMLKQNPLGIKSTPKDVASAALYLANAPSITGQILFVDGGSSLEK